MNVITFQFIILGKEMISLKSDDNLMKKFDDLCWFFTQETIEYNLYKVKIEFFKLYLFPLAVKLSKFHFPSYLEETFVGLLKFAFSDVDVQNFLRDLMRGEIVHI